jgi:hypothetical protein
VFTYYYPDGPGVAPLPNDDTLGTLDNLLRDYRRIYALFWGELEQDPERLVETTLDARAFEASSAWYGSVRLVIYAVPGEVASEIEVESNARFGEHITLLGYAISTRTLAPGEALGVTLFWQTDAPLTDRYKVFVHLYTPDGALIAQHDSEPGSDLAPTDTWRPGEEVIDNHGVLLPLEAAPGTYRLAVGLYDLTTGTRLPVVLNGEPLGDSLTISEITVP